MRLPESEWPELLVKHADVVLAVYVEECPLGLRQLEGEIAHAHMLRSSDGHSGTICFRSPDYLEPQTILHEVAHLIANAGHNGKWRRVLNRIGGSLDSQELIPGVAVIPSYHKRVRRGYYAKHGAWIARIHKETQ